MSSLPNLREYDDLDLAESPSDSEELFNAKFAERSRRRREAREREERERREREERERREREEREAREAREAQERQSREERERTAREEVRRGKVSAGRLKRRRPRGVTNRSFLSISVRRRWTRRRAPHALVASKGVRSVHREGARPGPARSVARSRGSAVW
jgi:hypothetical protein